MKLIQFSFQLIFLILFYEVYSFIKRYPVYCFEFEVFGKVQGIGFKETMKQNSLDWEIRGFAQDTKNNSVHGYIEVPANRVDEIKEWLSDKGPTGAVIEKAVFKNEKKLGEYSYKVFHTCIRLKARCC